MSFSSLTIPLLLTNIVNTYYVVLHPRTVSTLSTNLKSLSRSLSLSVFREVLGTKFQTRASLPCNSSNLPSPELRFQLVQALFKGLVRFDRTKGSYTENGYLKKTLTIICTIVL